MLFRQFVDPDLGCASYLIGSEAAGEAVVVDPAYAIEQYVDEAERHGLKIVRVVETHNHADHVAGHGRLALEHGARVSIHPLAEPTYAFDPIEDGTVITVGEVTIRVIHTPGHRPEHCALLVDERMLLTGDSLFVGDAARPDLAMGAAEGAEGLFHSLRRLEELNDEVGVYPGHVAGSLCGASLSSDPASTIGFERRFNRALKIGAVEDFVADALSKTTPRPPNMDRIVELNRGPFLGAPDQLPRLDGATGTVLDVRDADDFAAGHVPRAVNVPLSGSSFATRSGFVLGEGPVTVHAASQEQAEAAARGLRAVGRFDLAGYVVEPPDMTSQIDPVDLDELERLMQANEVVVLDVRESDERDEGYIAGSRHMPYRLLAAVSDGLGELPVVTICTTGARAAIAASLLAAQGIEARPVLDGGVEDWEQRGGRTIEFRRCGS
ncbi:MAG TPA: rhodanese-like domain-containing protein [Gaiellaceae bacterium]|nr:rhodanese-like domain-containing protein [Gaiellaceae bacterium]